MKLLSIIIFSILAFIALGATFIPYLKSKKWYVRLFDYPRLQTFLIAVAALIFFSRFYFEIGTRGIILGILMVVVIIIQGYKAWPYTFLGKKQVKDMEYESGDAGISLFICNVLQPNKRYDRVLNEVRRYDPDLVITTESNLAWQKGLEELEKDYPYLVQVPLENTYGMHLYSKLKLDEEKVRYLLDDGVPSIRTRVQLRNGEWITLFIIHPPPPVPQEAPDSKERDAELILTGKEACREKGGVIVAGDFNDVAWSDTTELFQRVTGFLDPRRGRGFFNTYHSGVPVFRWPLDHIFHSNHFKLIRMERGGKTGSDHFPMFVHLGYAPEERAEQPEVKKDHKTEEEAQETIEKGKEAEPVHSVR